MQPDGNSVKDELRGWLGSCTILHVLRVIALLLRSERSGVGRTMFLEAWCVCTSTFVKQ